jgi:hypothetical protein
MPLVQTRGAASAQGFGEFAQATAVNYIEDVFQPYIYTGTSATQTITNGIDLAGKGGLAWTRYRSGANAAGHFLADSVRGIANTIQTNTEAGQQATSYYTAFNSNGFSISSTTEINYLNTLYASWTFRKQTKFFDIITYTGNGTSGTTIAHNLGSTPGCVMVKSTSTGRRWAVYHRGNGATPQNKFLTLNKDIASVTSSVMWNNTAPTDAVFTLGSGTVVDAPTGEVTSTNENGVTYVAYLFAHNAGGFGLTGTDNVITCGSVVGIASPTVITLGYEPQWLLIKNADSAQDWWLLDNMRGLIVENAASSKRLNANDAVAETGLNVRPTATGFENGVMSVGQNYIYIAIRRGPMKVPTLGTNVFAAVSRTGTDANAVVTAGFPPDFLITKNRSGTASPIGSGVLDRMRPLNAFFSTSDTAAEDTVQTDELRSWNMTGVTLGPDANTSRFNWSANTYINYMFRRAAGYFDEVCYTGTGSATTVSHNLTVVPQLIIVKRRDANALWAVYSSTIGNTNYLSLNGSSGSSSDSGTFWNSTTPTSSVFSVNTGGQVNGSGGTFIAYLFASAPGVSKVGSYTGNGTTQTIDCGFGAGGARFVIIKRTDAAGDWYTYDTVRGMTVLTDPYLWLNTGAAEVASLGSVTTVSTGFALNAAIVAAINTNAASYIFLAIA